MRFISSLGKDVRGATAVEYGLILALIAVAALFAIKGVANQTINMWNNIAAQVSN
jgi:pilus assembly protein Flp/PilA